MSLAALRNVIVNYDEMKAEAQAEPAAAAWASPASHQHLPSHRRGGAPLRRRRAGHPPALRPAAQRTSPFYAFDQTTLVDSKAERLYVLLIRSGEAQFLRNNQLFTEIAKSFTVKPKG